MLSFIRRSILACAAIAALSASACSAADDGGASSDAITDIPTTPVRNQAGGNCPVYAFGSWAESLAKASTGRELDLSETYITYVMWRNLLVENKLEDGGKWVAEGAFYLNEIFDLVERYGLMTEAGFIPGEDADGYPRREAAARKKVERALKADGELATEAQRRDPENVRRVLDDAFGLEPRMRTAMTSLFGERLDQTLVGRRDVARPRGFLHPSDVIVGFVDGRADRPVTLGDAIGTAGERTRRGGYPYVVRDGNYAWNDMPFPARERDGRDLTRRLKAALNAGFGVVMGWYAMDGGVRTEDGSFRGRGRPQNDDAGHFSLIVDYAVDVPGFGSLEVGQRATVAQLEATLRDDAVIRYVRTKNSWGLRRGPGIVGPGGFNDVYWGEYLMVDSPEGGRRLTNLVLPPSSWSRVQRRAR